MNKTHKLFFVFLIAVLIVTTVQATSIVKNINVFVDGVSINNENRSVTSGDSIDITVLFESNITASDVKIKAWIDGYRTDIESETSRFDVLENVSYQKRLVLKIPNDLKRNSIYNLVIRIANRENADEFTYTLVNQRKSYNAEILSIESQSIVTAGNVLTASIVVKNMGNHKLEDVYVKASIPTLGVEKTVYIGSLVTEETDYKDDAKEAVIPLYLPKTSKGGLYSLVIEAYNKDVSVTKTELVYISEVQPSKKEELIVVTPVKETQRGKTERYEVVIMNLDDNIEAYTIAAYSVPGVIVTVDQPLVTIPAGQSKVVSINAEITGDASIGPNAITVIVTPQEGQTKQVTLSANVKSGRSIDTLLVVTIILAVVFLILLVVLIAIVASRKESASSETSYY